MRRRRFDHLLVQLSLGADRAIPRYALWSSLRELGWDPEFLSREAAIAFCGGPVHAFLADRGLRLGERAARRLQKSVHRYDPRFPTPEEVFARL